MEGDTIRLTSLLSDTIPSFLRSVGRAETFGIFHLKNLWKLEDARRIRN